MMNPNGQGHVINMEPSKLPLAQLESTRFKINQIIDSINALYRVVEGGNMNSMPPWPDILTKYNLLLSQTHNLSASLLATAAQEQNSHQNNSSTTSTSTSAAQASSSGKPFSKIALHPSRPLPESQFDADLAPLLRINQTFEIGRQESATVRRLSSALPTAGLQKERPNVPETHQAVIDACARIAHEHDARCERATRAVNLLRDQYDWRLRVEAEIDEEADHAVDVYSSLSTTPPPNPPITGGSSAEDADMDVDITQPYSPMTNDGNDLDSEDEAELEQVLGLQPSPVGTPRLDSDGFTYLGANDSNSF